MRFLEKGMQDDQKYDKLIENIADRSTICFPLTEKQAVQGKLQVFVVHATNLLKADGKYELDDMNDGGDNMSDPFTTFSFTTPEGQILQKTKW